MHSLLGISSGRLAWLILIQILKPVTFFMVNRYLTLGWTHEPRELT